MLRASYGGVPKFHETIMTIGALDPSCVTIYAEVALARIDELPAEGYRLLGLLADRHPARWRDAARAALAAGSSRSGRTAELLERVGSHEDIPLLRMVARSGRAVKKRKLGLTLARRLAPHVFVEDLGRVRIKLEGLEISDLDARRKVLELVSFLVTRSDMSATRDEVVEALWQDADPSSAQNSLNQTLYFLRRVFESDYQEQTSPRYVRHESDVVWLDSELVTSRSIRCRSILARQAAVDDDLVAWEIAAEYQARFALDFAYEEWATSYRDTLHASYLERMEAGIRVRLENGRVQEGIRLARRVLEIDSSADHIERLLLRGYHLSRAHAAVREQYGHYAAALRAELGVEAPSLDELIATDFGVDADT